MNFEKKTALIDKEKGLATGEVTPKDRLQNQIRLATEVFGRLKGFVDLSSEKARNDIMLFWTSEEDGESLSSLYRKIEDSEDFKFHPRIKGDIFSITADDVIYYKENNSLPED